MIHWVLCPKFSSITIKTQWTVWFIFWNILYLSKYAIIFEKSNLTENRGLLKVFTNYSKKKQSTKRSEKYQNEVIFQKIWKVQQHTVSHEIDCQGKIKRKCNES